MTLGRDLWGTPPARRQPAPRTTDRAKGAARGAEASEMVTVPRAELEALKAELRRLRREVGRDVARAGMQADPGPGGDARMFTRAQLAEAWGIGERSPGSLPRTVVAADRSAASAAALDGSAHYLPLAK
jgi:hypothetical protein